jgi:hypothetical protein
MTRTCELQFRVTSLLRASLHIYIRSDLQQSQRDGWSAPLPITSRKQDVLVVKVWVLSILFLRRPPPVVGDRDCSRLVSLCTLTNTIPAEICRTTERFKPLRHKETAAPHRRRDWASQNESGPSLRCPYRYEDANACDTQSDTASLLPKLSFCDTRY